MWYLDMLPRKCPVTGTRVPLLLLPYAGTNASLLFVVGEDKDNCSCILGHGLLRSECTEMFKPFLDHFVLAVGGPRPRAKVALCLRFNVHKTL